MNRTCMHASTHSRATDVLKAEHRVIESVLNAAERMLDQENIDRDFFLGTIDFLRNFADGCHHAKEEEEMFPVLESAGIPREGGPIGCMLHEHEQGRALIRAMAGALDAAAAGDPQSRQMLHRAAVQYIQLLRQHIAKEDNVLFFMADKVLDHSQQQHLLARFRNTEQEGGACGTHNRYVALAEELCLQAERRGSRP